MAGEATTTTPNPLPSPVIVMTVTTTTTQRRRRRSSVGLQQAQVRRVVAGCCRADRSQGRSPCAARKSACSLLLLSGLA
jgi:hypothetical protein